MNISAADFKATCLKLMDQVAETGQPVIITKHGRPVAQLGPVPAPDDSLLGYMQGTIRIEGDLLAPIDEPWSAASGDEDRLYAQQHDKPHSHRAGRKK